MEPAFLHHVLGRSGFFRYSFIRLGVRAIISPIHGDLVARCAADAPASAFPADLAGRFQGFTVEQPAPSPLARSLVNRQPQRLEVHLQIGPERRSAADQQAQLPPIRRASGNSLCPTSCERRSMEWLSAWRSHQVDRIVTLRRPGCVARCSADERRYRVGTPT